MLLLMFMLLAFLFGVLFLIVSGMTFAGNHFAPALTAKIAAGLFSIIAGIFNSKAWLIIAGLLIVPAGIFMLFRRHIRSRRQGWTLLATVLILSLSVTGINVASVISPITSPMPWYKKIRIWPISLSLSIFAASCYLIPLGFLIAKAFLNMCIRQNGR